MLAGETWGLRNIQLGVTVARELLPRIADVNEKKLSAKSQLFSRYFGFLLKLVR